MAISSSITPFLWFDTQAEDAASFYCSVFKNSKIEHVSRYPNDEVGNAGSAMTVQFELDGLPFIALNGGPQYTFTEAVSFSIACKDQSEVDYYWERLTDGGQPGPCGWLKDRFGLSWQVVPDALGEILGGDDRDKAERAFNKMLSMSKLIIADLESA